jgi:hypothetical protein
LGEVVGHAAEQRGHRHAASARADDYEGSNMRLTGAYCSPKRIFAFAC